MFDIGFSELVLIGVLALLVLGPKRLPEVARAAGRWMAQLRRFVSNVKQDFDREMQGGELEELRKLKRELDATRQAIAESGSRIVQDLAQSGNTTGGTSRFPHPDDPVTEPVILPTQTPARAKRKPATRKTSTKHGRRATAKKRR
jgi:sec-independent protein translocase protein TatB